MTFGTQFKTTLRGTTLIEMTKLYLHHQTRPLTLSGSMFSTSLSRAGIQLGAKWQFWKKTHFPRSMAERIMASARGPWKGKESQRLTCSPVFFSFVSSPPPGSPGLPQRKENTSRLVWTPEGCIQFLV